MRNEAKAFTKAQYITYCALFCALGALLPQAFHAFGSLSGTVFLPMHIPAMAAGFLLGPLAGLITGILSPLLSWLLTGGTMPIFIKMPFMMFEIGTYGVLCGVLYRLFARLRLPVLVKSVFTVLGAQIAGRLVNLLCTLFAVKILGITAKPVSLAAAVASIGTGIPGIVIQLVFLPMLMLALTQLRKHKNAFRS